MGMQPLSARSIRRIARTTGLDVIHGAANGGYWHAFVTSAHEHGAWHRHTHEWEWTNAACTTSCKRLFPDTPPVRHEQDTTSPAAPEPIPPSLADALHRRAQTLGARLHLPPGVR